MDKDIGKNALTQHQLRPQTDYKINANRFLFRQKSMFKKCHKSLQISNIRYNWLESDN